MQALPASAASIGCYGFATIYKKRACAPDMLFIAIAYVVERAIKVYQQRPNSGACIAGRRSWGHLQSGGLLSGLR